MKEMHCLGVSDLWQYLSRAGESMNELEYNYIKYVISFCRHLGEKHMYFRIPENIALRSWKFVPRAYFEKGEAYAKGLSDEEFDLMKMCDGEHVIEESELTKNLEARKLIERCEKGKKPSEWSLHKSYSNRYYPKMNLMITGKCNYNCLHCFNAADNAPIMSEWSYEELCDLLDQAQNCGINAFTITGGEPMMHPRFMDIVRGIYSRGMYIEELNTNGYFITQNILDELKAIGCMPQMKISFDGIGMHDWIRNHKGAEKRTLDAMELCVKNDFYVMAQTQVNRKNLHTLMPTAHKLGEMGVKSLRLIRTSEAPRWVQNAPDSCLDIAEYYEKMLEFSKEYCKSELKMNVIIWQFLRLFPWNKSYKLEAVSCPDGNYDVSKVLCSGARGMIAVASDGNVVPCMQMSFILGGRDIHLENLHETPLKDILTESECLKMTSVRLRHKLKDNPKCAGCEYLKYCCGGCPASGLLFAGDWKAPDLTKCLFYKQGWYQKSVKTLGDWTNATEIVGEV